MKRVLVLSLLLVGVIGAVGLAQNCCCCPAPQPQQPPCYTSFWTGEQIQIGLKVPFGLLCCCCCCEGPQIQVTGWQVKTWPGGTVVYDVNLDSPVSYHQFSATWDQKDASGNQVAAGFYTVVVKTTNGNYETYLKLVQRPEGCCFWPWLFSKYCTHSACKPYVTLSRTCVQPCCRISFYLGN